MFSRFLRSVLNFSSSKLMNICSVLASINLYKFLTNAFVCDCLFPILSTKTIARTAKKERPHIPHILHTMSAPNFVLNITIQTKTKIGTKSNCVYSSNAVVTNTSEYVNIITKNKTNRNFVYFSTHVALNVVSIFLHYIPILKMYIFFSFTCAFC